MSKKRIALHCASLGFLIAPNLIYLSCNFDILKEANTIALSLTALLILSLVGLGSLAHFKANKGIWVMLIGCFVFALSNVTYVAGIALIIEGAGLALDGYVFSPLITKAKVEELKKNGESVTYTKQL